MNILHINLADVARGAARAALRLHKAQMKLGHSSQMLVGYKKKSQPHIEALPVRNTRWQQGFYRFVNQWEQHTGLQYLWQPWKNQFLRHPFTQQAEVVNLHNIHSGYFSHTILPKLSHKAPLVWTLHDLWSITGHCCFPYMHECERWKTGCGKCPELSVYPAITIDTTAWLWRIKAKIYRHSNITVVTPSDWMADIVRQSPLLNRFEVHCIPHGLDIKLFKPMAKSAARQMLGIPADAKVILFAAFELHHKRKGGVFLFEALQRLVAEGRKDLRLVIVGAEKVVLDAKYKFPVQSLGLIKDESTMALCFNAADLYAGPSLAESFGLVYMEAMACGTPVIAFDCTAVPEVVRHLETGYLAHVEDVDDLTHGMRLLLDDDALREKLGRQSRELVEREYTLKLQAQRYVELYQRVIDRKNHLHAAPLNANAINA